MVKAVAGVLHPSPPSVRVGGEREGDQTSVSAAKAAAPPPAPPFSGHLHPTPPSVKAADKAAADKAAAPPFSGDLCVGGGCLPPAFQGWSRRSRGGRPHRSRTWGPRFAAAGGRRQPCPEVGGDAKTKAMTGSPERDVPSNIPSTESIDRSSGAASLEEKAGHIRSSKVSLWSSLFTSPFSVIESHPESSSGEKVYKSTSYWTTTVKKILTIGSMRRFQERFLGTSTADMSSSTSDIWFLGSCYKVLQEDASKAGNGLVEFLQDFSSRIWVTYRKGFDAIDEKSKLTSDANWGCMIRSSQMLVAQALLFHHLGRSWRKSMQKPYDPEYIEILHLFGDSESCTFSIHNLLQAGRDYGLAAGSWLGPYAMCRAWETLARTNKEPADRVKGNGTLPMAVYIVSGDEAGQRGGAPAVCIDTAARLSSDFSVGMQTWAPLLLLVPLVLGLEKINPRYIPLLLETFTFPQSLGILGGKPGASTYIAGVQDDKALYLDPHVVQPVVHIRRGELEADTSSYHCSTIRHLQLDLIDPSLAIGFYCRDEEDFKDFCSRASKLEDLSNGAPLFTVTQSLHDVVADSSHGTNDNGEGKTFDLDNFNDNDAVADEDDWQIL